MFSKKKAPHKRSSSPPSIANHNHVHATTIDILPGGEQRERAVETPVISPLNMTFDFELSPIGSSLPSPFSPTAETSSSRPQTRDGPPPRIDSTTANQQVRSPSLKSPGGGLPLLPPIPQVASRNSSTRSAMSPNAQVGRSTSGKSAQYRSVSDNVTTPTSFDHPWDFSTRPTASSKEQLRPKTSHGAFAAPQMEASLFPARPRTPGTPSSPSLPPMNRSFIDSRDRPYSPPQRPMTLQANHSSPNVSAGRTPVTSARGLTPIYSSRPSPQPSTQQSDYSGSTARPSTHASSHTAFSAGPAITIGTPYGETADSFPLPQHVETRPKTPGAVSRVAGVTIPTHHTSAIKTPSKPDSRKSEPPKKKGRLLNPMLLLQRRRSSQDPEVVIAEKQAREAQEQALQRQKDVLASGINKPPPDFDPRIKGKVVHDFSSPREKRNTFDELDMPAQLASPMQSPSLNPSRSPTLYPPRNESLSHREKRRSTHTPVFKEDLDENLDSSKRISSINAESRENKDFLQRASRTELSRESAVLPPFARRSQMLDPLQASFFRDDESRRSSGPSGGKEGESTSSDVGEISPATARSSSNDAISPVSPTSPFGSSRPVSQITQTLAQDQAARPASQPSKPSSPDSSKHGSERLSRPYSVILAPPQIDTIAEGSVDSSPVEPQGGRSTHEPQTLARGVSIHNSKSASPSNAETTQPSDAKSPSSSSRSLLERTADMQTPDQTPELVQDARAFKTQSTQDTSPKLVEKRKSAAGHSKKISTLPKHNPSTASRFSFQFGESAAQEQALEEKHRKVVSRDGSQPVVRGASPDADDDDYFDEDAMNDMDELEMQASQEDLHLKPMVTVSSQPGDGSITHAGSSQSSLYLQQAREALQQPAHSDDGSVYDEDNIPEITDEQDIPYADHPAFRAHSALGGNSRHNSMMPDAAGGYWRDSTIDHYMRDSYAPPSMRQSRIPNDHLSVNDHRASRPRSDFYLHPSSSANSLNKPKIPEKPPLPHRDSGNSERNRVASGINFASPLVTPSSEQGELIQSRSRGPTVSSTKSNASSFLDSPADGGLYMHGAASRSIPNVNFVAPAVPATSTGTRAISPPSSASSQPAGTTAVSSDRGTLHKGIDVRNGSPGASRLLSPVAGKREIDQNKSGLQADSSSAEAVRKDSTAPLRLISHANVQHGHRHTSSAMSFEDFAKTGFAESPYDEDRSATDQGPLTPPHGTTMAAKSTSHPANRSSSSSNAYAAPEGEDQVSEATPPTTVEQHGRDSAIGSASSPPNSSLPRKPLPSARVGTSTSLPRSPYSNKDTNSPSRFAGFNFANSPHQVASHNRVGSDQSRPISQTVHPMEFGQPRGGDGLGVSVPSGFDFDSQDRDDMYFDDGNFDLDLNGPNSSKFDEDAFDDENFLYRPNAAVNAPHGYGHRRVQSGASVGDGPYPTFAMPNADKVRARNSQLMLEDLPLQTPIDPKYIPQRNPSEDAKRLGLSDKAPPVPVMETNKEAFLAMQNNLQKYHAALAEAANKAADQGRFVRTPSVSSTPSTSLSAKPSNARPSMTVDAQSLNDDQSVYSNDERGGDGHMLPTNGQSSLDRSGTQASHLTHITGYSPHKMSFDFGFDQAGLDFDDYGNDDDLIAAANAEVLASDDEGFYGQEFQFYGRPRANSDELEAINGGFFGEDGDNGLQRNKSLREPNLTPITERSEFSTRNSFVGFLPGMHGPPSAGFPPHSPALARMPITPLMEDDITSFDDLRKLRAQTFGSSNRSEKSSSNRSSQHSSHGVASPSLDTSTGLYPMQHGYSGSGSSGSNASSAAPRLSSSDLHHASPSQNFQSFQFHDSPQSATSSNGNPFSMDVDSTPKRHTVSAEPVTAKKISPPMFSSESPTSPGRSSKHGHTGHSSQGSGTEVTYVQEPDPTGAGRPRWVMERRRTSEQGNLELVGRELVQGGWI